MDQDEFWEECRLASYHTVSLVALHMSVSYLTCTVIPQVTNFIISFFLKKKDFIYLFLERWMREKEGEKHQCVVASHVSPLGTHLACNPGMYPNWESNWPPFSSKAGTQSTEPHQPGLISFFTELECFIFSELPLLKYVVIISFHDCVLNLSVY